MSSLNYETNSFLKLEDKVYNTLDADGLPYTKDNIASALEKIDSTAPFESFVTEHNKRVDELDLYNKTLKQIKEGKLELVAQDKTNLLTKPKGAEDLGFFGKGGTYVRIPSQVRAETQPYDPSNLAATTAGKLAGGTIRPLVGFAVDFISPEAQQSIAKYLKSIPVGERENLYTMGQGLLRGFESFTDPPQLGDMEKVSAELAATMVGGNVLKRILNKKTNQPINRTLLGEVTEDVITYGTAGIFVTDADESIVNTIAEEFPESKEYIGALVVNPEDSQALEYIKRLPEEVGITASVSSILRGIGRIRAKRKAHDDGILDPKNLPIDDNIKQINIKEDGGEIGQAVEIEQPVRLLTDSKKGKVITGKYDPRRYLTSQQGFDEQTFRAMNKKSDQAGKNAIIIKHKANKLKRTIERAYGIKYENLNAQQINTLNEALGKELPIGESMSKKVKTALAKSSAQRTDADRTLIDNYYSQLNDAARVNQKQALDSLPEELRDTVLEMRNAIDSYSNQLSKLGLTDKINATINAKKGIYMNTEYEAFVNPAYTKKLKKAIEGSDVDILLNDSELVAALDGARKFFKSHLKPGEGGNVDGLMNQFVQSITKNDEGLFEFLTKKNIIKSSRPGTDKVLNTRELIPSELRRVLKQVDDPLQRVSSTLKKQTDLITDVNFIKDIRKIAEDSGYSSDIYKITGKPEDKFTQSLEGSASSYVEQALGKNPLANVFVTQDFKNMFDKGLEIAEPENIFSKSLMGLSSAASLSQTVLSEATHLINIKGNMIMMAANGNLDAVLTQAKNVADVVQAAPRIENLIGRKTKGVTFKDHDINVDELSKMYSLGLIDNSVTAEMITKGFDAALKGPVLKKIKEKTIDPLSNIYRGEDAAFKLLSYYKELDQYAKAFPDMPKEQLEVYVADVVKNTLPSYSNLPRAIKSLKSLPLGAFPAFFVESIRTSKNIAKIGIQDLRKGAALTARGVASGDKELMKQGAMLTRIGTRRVASLGAVAYAGETYFTYRNSEMGITPKEDQVLSSLGPRWENGTTLKEYQTPLIMDERGDIKYTYINQSFSDPYDVIRKIYKITAAYTASPPEGEVGHVPFDQYLQDNIKLLAPVAGPSLMVQSVTEAITGMDEFGKPIDEGGMQELLTRIGKAASPLEPRTIKDIREVVALVDKSGVGETGYPKRLEDKLARLYGTRQVTVDLGKNVRFNAYKINSQINNYNRLFNKEISALQQYNNITPKIKEDLFKKLDSIVKKSFDEQGKLTTLYNDVKSLSYGVKDKDNNVQRRDQMTDAVLEKLLVRQGTEKIDDNMLTSIAKRGNGTFGEFLPPEIINAFKKIKRELPKGQAEALEREINQRYLSLKGNPLIYKEED